MVRLCNDQICSTDSPFVGAPHLFAVEIGKHQDVEQLGAGTGAERVEAFS
jgi:hypothetical protein